MKRALLGLLILMFATFSAAQSAREMFKRAFELYRAGNFDSAAEGFESGLVLEPRSYLGHFWLAETNAQLGRTEAAVDHYIQTIELAPESAEATKSVKRVKSVYGERGAPTLREATEAEFDGPSRPDQSRACVQDNVKVLVSRLAYATVQYSVHMVENRCPGTITVFYCHEDGGAVEGSCLSSSKMTSAIIPPGGSFPASWYAHAHRISWFTCPSNTKPLEVEYRYGRLHYAGCGRA